MARYSKSYSNYILKKRHQDVIGGTIFERDWVTTGAVHRLEPGKKPFYSDSNFIFTDNALPFFKKKHDYGKWVAHFVYDDVKDASPDVNIVKLNRESDDLRSYAYYGSMEDIVRGSLENIIKTFPGRLRSTTIALELPEPDGEMVSTGFPILENQFSVDMHTENVSTADFENQLHYISASWSNYEVTWNDTDSGDVMKSPITSYSIENAEWEIFISPKYHDYGYEYLRYKDYLYKWDEVDKEYHKVEYSSNCSNYFVRCDEYIRYGDKYYEWSEEDACYIGIDVYEICNDNYQKLFNIFIGTEEEASFKVCAYRMNGSVVYCLDTNNSADNNIIIEPNADVIDSYFASLDGFEKKLLTRDTKPLYRNKFKVPRQLTNGSYVMVERIFIWPSNGYCIDIESMSYLSFANSLLDMGAMYDNAFSDCIWRCMTHESIKNFDWTYRREFTENDAQDNIDGGNRMMEVMHFYGRLYDNAKRYIDGIKFTNNVTYDGYDNLPDAEISDKNTLKGWDVVSTIWEPYYYAGIDIADIPQGAEIVPYPALPNDISSESPEYISIGCGPNAAYYHRYFNDPSTEFLTDEFLESDDYIIGKYEPWITHNHNLIYLDIGCKMPEDAESAPVSISSVPLVATADDPDYIQVRQHYYKKSYAVYSQLTANPMQGFTNYWGDNNTFSKIPSTLTSESPEYIRVSSNGFYTYYALSDTGFNNLSHMHGRWFNSKNPNSTTPVSSDINFQRHLYLSTNRIFKTKGTKASIDMVMGLFGFGSDGEFPDYTVTEYFNMTSPIKASDIFYFYEPLESSPSGVVWNSGNTFTSFESATDNVTAGSPEYIKVVSNGVSNYYILVSDYTYEEMVLEFARHKTIERVYDTVYSGTPLNDILIGNDKYLIPYHTNSRSYDGYLYFQQKGGWGKATNTTSVEYDYAETIPYLHLLPDVASLLSVRPNDLNGDDVYYVFDTTDYVDFDEDVPFDLSNFFKVSDPYNPQRFSSWKNIPMEGEIVYNNAYDKNGVSHKDYLHAKYLSGIIPTVLFNNPHTGNGEYDMGEDFVSYMGAPYKYLFETYNFDDPKYIDIARQFTFTVEKHATEDATGKFVKWLKTVSYAYNEGILEQIITPLESDKYFLNNKVIILRNENNSVFHNKFLKDVVMKYVLQVIPSTAILVLENFNTIPASEMNYYNIDTRPNNQSYGATYGDGRYLDTTFAVLRAEEKEGYHFVRWVVDGSSQVISTEPVVQVRVCGDQRYEAVFEADCIITTECNTVCAIDVSCETEEPCDITLLCETEDQCDMYIEEGEESVEDMAVIEFRMGVQGVSSADDAAEVLKDVCLFDSTCNAYNTVLDGGRPYHISFNPSDEGCITTKYPVYADDIEPSVLTTVADRKSYSAGSPLGVCWATTAYGSLSRWLVEYPDGTQVSFLTNPITFVLEAGNTKITAIFNTENV